MIQLINIMVLRKRNPKKAYGDKVQCWWFTFSQFHHLFTSLKHLWRETHDVTWCLQLCFELYYLVRSAWSGLTLTWCITFLKKFKMVSNLYQLLLMNIIVSCDIKASSVWNGCSRTGQVLQLFSSSCEGPLWWHSLSLIGLKLYWLAWRVVHFYSHLRFKENNRTVMQE